MKSWIERRIGWGVALVAALLLLALAGCDLFNSVPVARITASLLSGTSPLAVLFDASDSYDPDAGGVIVAYLWEFGDGETDTGETVTHTFLATTEARTFTVTLTVVDDQGGRGETSQTIEVLAGGAEDPVGEGAPVAWFTVDRLIGVIPFRVVFDASGSTGGAGNIIEYSWDFGDDGTAVGTPVTHTYEPERTETFTVTLRVWNSQGQFDTEQKQVIAIVPGDVTGDEEPVATFVNSDPNMIRESEDRPNTPSLFEITFDPRGSFADAGHAIEYYLWEFGDGEFRVEESDLEVTHIYELTSLSTTYVARLTVFDDQGLEGTVTANITLTDPFGPGDIDAD